MHVCLCVCVCVCSVIAAIIDFKPRTIHVNCSSRIRFHNWRLPSGVRPTSEGKVWPVRRGRGVGRAQGVGICTLAIRLRPRVDSNCRGIASHCIDCNLQGKRGVGPRGAGKGACQGPPVGALFRRAASLVGVGKYIIKHVRAECIVNRSSSSSSSKCCCCC